MSSFSHNMRSWDGPSEIDHLAREAPSRGGPGNRGDSASCVSSLFEPAGTSNVVSLR